MEEGGGGQELFSTWAVAVAACADNWDWGCRLCEAATMGSSLFRGSSVIRTVPWYRVCFRCITDARLALPSRPACRVLIKTLNWGQHCSLMACPCGCVVAPRPRHQLFMSDEIVKGVIQITAPPNRRVYQSGVMTRLESVISTSQVRVWLVACAVPVDVAVVTRIVLSFITNRSVL